MISRLHFVDCVKMFVRESLSLGHYFEAVGSLSHLDLKTGQAKSDNSFFSISSSTPYLQQIQPQTVPNIQMYVN